jgi:hypothetical protein
MANRQASFSVELDFLVEIAKPFYRLQCNKLKETSYTYCQEYLYRVAALSINIIPPPQGV